MKILNKMLILITAVSAVLMTACPNALVPFNSAIVDQAKDDIAPGISIAYPEDNSSYSKTILISGTATDLMTEDGRPGAVVSVGYTVLGTALSDSTVPSGDGSFSFLIQSASFSGNNIAISLYAEDLNGNTAEETINLVYQDSDIASFSIQPGNSEVTLFWDIPPETTGFRLLNILSGEEKVLSAAVDSFTWTELENGELAFFQLYADDSQGNTNVSDIISTMPISPYTLVPEVYGNIDGIHISWPELKDADRYVVERANARSGSYEIKFITSSTKVFDSAVSAGSSYFYRVYPEGYESIKSDSARIKPLSYGENWTAKGTSGLQLDSAFSGRQGTVFTDGDRSYLYYLSDSYTCACAEIDAFGNLDSLGDLIDVSSFAADAVTYTLADSDNGILFVFTGEDGMWVYDISDPELPVLKNSESYTFGIDGPYFIYAVIQKAGGNYYLYLSTPTSIMQIEYSYSTVSGFSVMSTDTFNFPSSPGFYRSSGPLFYDFSSGLLYDHYYCSTAGYETEGYYCFNISTPSAWRSSPQSTTLSDSGTERCMGITGNSERLAVLKRDGVEIIDLSTDTIEKDVNLDGTMKSITLSGELLLVSTYSRGIQLLNISAQVPSVIGGYATSDLAQNTFKLGGKYFALTTSSIEEFIISFPDTFNFSSWYGGSGWVMNTDNYQGGVLVDEELILGRQTSTTISLDSWSLNDGVPVSAEHIYNPNGYDFAAQGTRLAVSNIYTDSDALFLTNIVDGEMTVQFNIPESFNYLAYNCEDLYCTSGQRIYLSDVSKDGEFQELSSHLLDEQVNGELSFRDDYIYIPLRYSAGLTILHKKADSSLEYIGTVGASVFSAGTYVNLIDSLVIGDNLFVLYNDTTLKMTGVVGFSLSDPSAPSEVGRYEYSYSTAGSQYVISKLEASGHILFGLTGEAYSAPGTSGRGIHLLDISEPSNIREIAEIDFSQIITDFYTDESIIATSKDFIVDGNDIYFISRYAMFHIEY